MQLDTKFGDVNTMIPVTVINPLEYYNDALEICDNKLNQNITDCENYKSFCEQQMKLYCDNKKSCTTRINDLDNENKDLKNQIDSNNQDNKNPNNSQSTQTTFIIICVLIIVLLLGLCIYLYFFKR